MKDTKRAERRHHAEHLVRRFTKVASAQGADDPLKAGRKMADHPKLCSCYMCGNPRRSTAYKGKSRLTKQELKQIDREKE